MSAIAVTRVSADQPKVTPVTIRRIESFTATANPLRDGFHPACLHIQYYRRSAGLPSTRGWSHPAAVRTTASNLLGRSTGSLNRARVHRRDEARVERLIALQSRAEREKRCLRRRLVRHEHVQYLPRIFPSRRYCVTTIWYVSSLTKRYSEAY